MKTFLVIFCLIMATFHGYTQSVYTYDIKKDIPIGSLSLGLFITPFFISSSPGEVITSQKDRVNPFDRSLMFSYHKPLDIVGDIGMYGLAVLPILSLAGNITDLNAVATYSIMYAEAILSTYGTLEIVKISVARNRPYTYFDGIPDGQEKDYFKSFPSRHSAIAFMSAGFLSSTFSSEYPESKWKLPVIIGSYMLATGIASLRIASGNHFMTDVLTGAAIGSFYGWIIPFLHKNKKTTDKFAIHCTGNGFFISLQ